MGGITYGVLGGTLKKITLYTNEKELEQFDSKIPKGSRSEILRKLMNHYTYLKSHGLAEGIILAKPMEGQDSFLVKLLDAYVADNVTFFAGNIIRIPTNDILKHNLELGDTVKLNLNDGKPLEESEEVKTK